MNYSSEIRKWVSKTKHTTKEGLFYLPQYKTINKRNKFTAKEIHDLTIFRHILLPLPIAVARYHIGANQTVINVEVTHSSPLIISLAIITLGLPILLLFPDIIALGGDEHLKEVNKIITAGSFVFLMVIISYFTIAFPVQQITEFIEKELNLQKVD